MNSMALSIKNLTGSINHHTIEQEINLDLYQGQVLAITNESLGACLFRLILGMGDIGRDSSVEIPHANLHLLHHNEVLQKWRPYFGFASREKGLLSNLTILDNVCLPASYHSAANPVENAKKFLAELEVDQQFLSMRPDFVDESIRKRTLLARALMLNPSVLLLESPATFLNWELQDILERWIEARLAQKVSLIFTSPSAAIITRFANFVLDEKTGILQDDIASYLKQRMHYQDKNTLTPQGDCPK